MPPLLATMAVGDRLSKGEAKVGEKDEEEEVPKLLEFTVKENVEGMHYSNCVF